MPERIKSNELALTAANTANQVFGEMQRVGATHEMYGRLNTEFLTLQAMAGIVLAPPVYVEREAQIEKRLNMPVLELMDDLKIRSSVQLPSSHRLDMRIGTILRGEGNPSLRELLVKGYDNVKDIHNLGKKGMDLLEAVREATAPDIAWPSRLDGGFAAQLYTSLDEIPARVIDSVLNSLPPNEDRPNSVGMLLSLSDTDLRTNLQYAHTVSRRRSSIHVMIGNIRRKLRNFAAEFEQAHSAR